MSLTGISSMALSIANGCRLTISLVHLPQQVLAIS